jgi:hypothetical protein
VQAVLKHQAMKQVATGVFVIALCGIGASIRADDASERPRSDQARRDQWMVRFSKTVGKNLAPFFAAWDVPITETAQKQIADLPAWMPPDFVLQ